MVENQETTSTTTNTKKKKRLKVPSNLKKNGEAFKHFIELLMSLKATGFHKAPEIEKQNTRSF